MRAQQHALADLIYAIRVDNMRGGKRSSPLYRRQSPRRPLTATRVQGEQSPQANWWSRCTPILAIAERRRCRKKLDPPGWNPRQVDRAAAAAAASFLSERLRMAKALRALLALAALAGPSG